MKRRQDEVAEWLRRWTANPLGFPRVGSNPILVDQFFDQFTQLLRAKCPLNLEKIEVTYFASSISQAYFLSYNFPMVHFHFLI